MIKLKLYYSEQNRYELEYIAMKEFTVKELFAFQFSQDFAILHNFSYLDYDFLRKIFKILKFVKRVEIDELYVVIITSSEAKRIADELERKYSERLKRMLRDSELSAYVEFRTKDDLKRETNNVFLFLRGAVDDVRSFFNTLMRIYEDACIVAEVI